MATWDRARTKRVKRVARVLAVLAPAAYFAPLLTGAMVACGAVDVGRHRRRSYELFEKYFAGNGLLTWLLSPLNLLADAFSYRNKGRYALADLPPACRAEVETCVRAYRENGDRIKAHIAAEAGASNRSMLTFRWYDAVQDTALRIPAFESDFQHVKTIAVSAFNRRERTSRHFGPLRLTFRVLYNLEPINSDAVSIEVDGVTHYWRDDPLFIFDDTFFHQSVNDADMVRHCLFMDIIRPNHAPAAFAVAVRATSAVASSFKRLFYSHWSFIR
jgi:aspartyl/asparaginyl beta-hydroxylase (cupin superfamily)